MSELRLMNDLSFSSEEETASNHFSLIEGERGTDKHLQRELFSPPEV